MSEMEFIGTTINDKTVVPLAVGDVLQSQLLEESLKSEPFASLFAWTTAHDEPWEGVGDIQKLWMGMWLTPILSDEPPRRISAGRVSEDAAVADDPLAKANRDRVTLLARKYVAKDNFSSEERARLEIVTERVRRLLPAVTVAEFESLAQVLELIKQARELDADIRSQLGISSKKNG